MRDFRINLIFEGTSEIMRLFIAREAVDHHFKTAFDVVNPKASKAEKWAALVRSAKYYPGWYAKRWIGGFDRYGEFGRLAKHMRYVAGTTRKLGRSIFHAMIKLGPTLERRQMVLFRAVDIGAELFAMSAACVRAQMLVKRGDTNAVDLADLFCREARLRIADSFRMLFGPNDASIYRVSQQVLRGEFTWLEAGIVDEMLTATVSASTKRERRPAIRREEAGVGD
ncbi:MAG: acyl-CoA dehydrogenase, partial [Gemmatimonadaceae bacterium]